MTMEIPKHYSLKEDNKDHFVIHDARDNKPFKVSKKELHPAHQIKIMRLQKFSGDSGDPDDSVVKDETGGELDADTKETLAKRSDQLKEIPGAVGNFLFGQGPLMFTDQGQQTEAPAPTAPAISSPNPPQISPQATDQLDQEMGKAPPEIDNAAPPPPTDPFAGTPYGAAFGLQQRSIDEGLKAQQDYQKQVAEAEMKHQQDMAAFNYQANQEAWNKKVELDNLDQEMRANPIKAGRIWSNASVGSKIGAIISVVLGGLGAALSHGPNQGLQMVNNLMDKDLEEQKSNMANKQNLYAMNMKKYNDQEMADNATRLQMNSALQSQLRVAAASAGTMQARAMADQLNAQLQMNKAQLLQQWGVQAAKNKVLGVASGEGGLPVTQEPSILMNDPKYIAKRVQVGDKVYQASSDKEGEELRTASAMLRPIERDINMLQQIGPAALADPAKYQKAQGIAGRLAMQVNEFNGYKRFTDVDDKVISKQFNNPATIKALVAGNASNIDTLKALRGKMESEYQNKLVNYKGSRAVSFTPVTGGALPLNKNAK